MKIISYNVNGIRAAMAKDFTTWLQAANPDVICLQEIKATEDQIDKDAITQAGYPFQYYFSAQKKGYSGVAILSKTKPLKVTFGTGIDYMDFEGRNLRADFENLSVMSMYLPSGTNIERLDFKFQYMDGIKEYLNNLKTEMPNLVVCGDYNICHQAIDIHNPKGNEKTSGFLPEERAWLDGLMKTGWVDTFRHLNKEPHHYSWWSYRAGARGNNKGWRIDYCLATENLINKIQKSFILPGAVHSDHCPIGVEIF
jgi:exodeoxyribonuclease III